MLRQEEGRLPDRRGLPCTPTAPTRDDVRHTDPSGPPAASPGDDNELITELFGDSSPQYSHSGKFTAAASPAAARCVVCEWVVYLRVGGGPMPHPRKAPPTAWGLLRPSFPPQPPLPSLPEDQGERDGYGWMPGLMGQPNACADRVPRGALSLRTGSRSAPEGQSLKARVTAWT
jgi:hypothetical protein